MFENALKAAQKLVFEKFKNVPLDSLVIDEIKGYQTTNVYKLELQDGGIPKCMFIKESSDLKNDLYNQFIQNEYKNTEYIYKHFNSTDSLKTVEPIVLYKDLNIFFMSEIKGTRLDIVLKGYIKNRCFGEIKLLINMCKAWLYEFHKIDPIIQSDSGGLIELEKNKLDFLHGKFIKKAPSSDQEEIEKIVLELSNKRNSLVISDQDIRCKHNDFAPWNILYADKRITVYDFADLNVDYKYYDLLYFAHSLEKISKKMIFSKGFVDKVKYEVIGSENIPTDVLSYYSMYFNLQDAASYLPKINQGGLKSYFYKYLYKKSLRLAASS